MSVQAMKAGAADFLTKPVPSRVLIAAARDAIDRAAAARQAKGDTDPPTNRSPPTSA
jgi:FixJ family two-component response regulator